MNNSIEGSVFVGSVYVGRLLFPLVVFKEVGVSDGIDVYMARGASGRSEEGVMLFVISFMRGKEELRFVDGFVNGKGLGGPVDCQVSGP